MTETDLEWQLVGEDHVEAEPRDGSEESHLVVGDDLAVVLYARVLLEVASAGAVEDGVRHRVAQRRGGMVYRHGRLRAAAGAAAALHGVRHHGRQHGVHHHVPRDDVHHHAEVGEERRDLPLGVADDERVDGARALHPPRHRVRPDAGDDAGPHDHHRHVAVAATELLLPQQHLAHGLGEDVRVGPPEVARPLQAQLLHRLPLRRSRVVAAGAGAGGIRRRRHIILDVADEAQLVVDVEVHAFPQRLAGLDGLLQDQLRAVAGHIGCMHCEHAGRSISFFAARQH